MRIRRKFKGRNDKLNKYRLGSTVDTTSNIPGTPGYDPTKPTVLGAGVQPFSTQDGTVHGNKPIGAGLPNKYPWDLDMSGGARPVNTDLPTIPLLTDNTTTNATTNTTSNTTIDDSGLEEGFLDDELAQIEADKTFFNSEAAKGVSFEPTEPEYNDEFMKEANDAAMEKSSQELDNSVGKEEKIQKGTKSDDYFNPYGGVDIPGAATILGESIETGNVLGMVGSGLKLAAGLGRNIMGGKGDAHRKEYMLQEFRDKQRKSKTEGTEYAKEGGSLQNDLQYFQDGRDLEIEEITGSKRKGDEEAPANAELEKGEFFEEPKGTPTEVIGKKHSEGGEKMNLQKDTKVLSDFTKINKKQAKELSDEMGFKFTGKETYATVLSKFNKKIGLTDIIEEEEEVIAEIKSQKDSEVENVNEESLNINLEFLSSKLNDLTAQKEELEELSSGAFSRIFDMQESLKPQENKPQDEFKIGGRVYGKAEILDIAKQFNVEEDKALDIITKMTGGGYIPPLEDEEDWTPSKKNKSKNPPKILVTDEDREDYRDEHLKKLEEENKKYEGVPPGIVHIIKQAKQSGYGKEVTPENIGEHMVAIQAHNVKKDRAGVIKYFKDGVAITADGVDMLKKSNPEYFRELGLDINRASAKFSEEERIKLQNNHIAKGNDTDEFWLKQYQDGRHDYRAPNMPILKGTPVGLKEIRGNEIDLDAKLTEDFKRLKAKYPTVPEEELVKKVEKDRKQFNGMLLPENLPMLPPGLQMPTKITTRLGRAEANLISPDAQLTEIERGVHAAKTKLDNLPSGQREAAIMQLQSNAQAQKNKVISSVEQHNNKVKQTTDFFNIRQSGREELARNANTRDFEDKAFTAMANTESDFRRFFNTVQERNVQNFSFVESKNLLNQTSENFDYSGNGVGFTGGADLNEGDWEQRLKTQQATAISNRRAIEAEKKKKKAEKKKRGGRIKRNKKY